MMEALRMLQSVFLTKKTPAAEQAVRFRQIFTETVTWELFPDWRTFYCTDKDEP